MTNIEVVARTFENKTVEKLTGGRVTCEQLNDMLINDTELLSGKAAGVCYMPDNYLSEGIQNEDSARSKAKMTSGNCHFSVFGHMKITMTVETSKMNCMILNSLGVYDTSEKSARYTVMKPETQLELDMYNKWKDKIHELVLDKYPDFDDAELSKRLCKKMGIEYDPQAVINGSFGHIKDDEYVEEELKKLKLSKTLPSYKMAQENARYMISVFTPTTMLHTVSYQQLCLISNYYEKLIIELKECDFTNTFRDKLLKDAVEFKAAIDKVLGDARFVEDNKNQYIRLLSAQHKGMVYFYNDADGNRKYTYTKFGIDRTAREFKHKDDSIADSYTLNYRGSLAMLAQLQRHRTLRYTMFLEDAISFYVPTIVKTYGLEDEWLEDIKSVSYCIPQGTLVDITEQGIFEDFLLKCKERLCGRAQLEIMQRTIIDLMKFVDQKDYLSEENQMLLEMDTNDDTVIPRCMFKDFKCKETCRWKANHAFDRLV